MKLSPAIPILRIFSEAKAREFYLDFLGFQLLWEHRFEPGLPLYAAVKRGELELHLSEHHGDATPGSTVFVPMEGIDALHAELIGKQYGYARPGIEQQDWGRELTVADPFGNRLRFAELKRD
ncbi:MULTISPECIES: glyoxalase superfamily protein [unclassified Burkholderia]|uniref:glyoxalase superfamily protein n=1 Tax=unclassified Burkholderia TaxID=2613784 RepID=UPI00046AE987|nr:MULTISPECIES: glyoxalase superfamily protein [unclassified Burkholderia]NIE82097.1 VOC family protein [Burkholderia sp. Tr-860]NIF66075.1 VOC family protein [Burkholderia sp. Cy-647]NIF95221.1 VOC family protein [Burkholderia sp. Ax-1720]